ncbi:MAG: DUF72 domain-containing protein [bacterium]
MQKMKINIGTSGWIYPHWRGCFYPENLPQKSWFQFYSRSFSTVEINNTFYRLPSERAVESWQRQAPKNFIYAVKASRFITHVKKLKEPKEGLQNFMERINLLGEHLGPVLFQLPPRWRPNLQRFETFLKTLTDFSSHLWVFEFRQLDWFAQDILDLLMHFKVGFCIHDMAGLDCPKAVTAKYVYLRFHGPSGAYLGRYGQKTLQACAEFIKEQAKKGHEIYAYFNNDLGGAAVEDARTLKELLAV